MEMEDSFSYCENREIPRTPLAVPPTPALKMIDVGTGVSVYSFQRTSLSGKYRSPWALKKISRRCKDQDIICRLNREGELLKKLNHPNIVGFRAMVRTEGGGQCLAMEECSYSLGNLIEQRYDYMLGPYPASVIMKVGSDVAKALHYLHSECKLLHGDVKSFNVLIKGDFEIAKLCDFGVSLPLDENGVVVDPQSEYIGTELWAAAEVLGDGPVTTKADMFSYGLVLYEMVVLCPPHSDYIPVDNRGYLSTAGMFESPKCFDPNDSVSSMSTILDDSMCGQNESMCDNENQNYSLTNISECNNISTPKKTLLETQSVKNNESVNDSMQNEGYLEPGDTVTPEETDTSNRTGTRPILPPLDLSKEYDCIIKLFNWCTEEDYTARPTAQQAAQFLESPTLTASNETLQI